MLLHYKLKYINGIFHYNKIPYNGKVIDDMNFIYYIKNGKYHNDDGPAIYDSQFENGDKYYYNNGKLHRLNGPAIILFNGDKEWIQNDLYHREDGPAIEREGNYKEWWLYDKKLNCKTQEEFNKIINLKLFW